MMSPSLFATSTNVGRGMPYGLALRYAIAGLRWRAVGVALLIAAVFEAWSLFDVSFSSSEEKSLTAEDLLSTVAVNLVVAFTTMLAARIADEQAAHGLKRLPTYAVAVVLGSVCGAITRWLVLQGSSLPSAPYSDVTQSAQVFVEYLIWSSIIVFLYVNRSNAARAAAHMNAAQLHRAETQRRTLESQLQVLQARIEPQFLHNTLKHVRDLYEVEPSKGALLLDHLIVYLRAALPHFRLSTSTLAQELDLISAYVKIKQSHAVHELVFDIDAGSVERSARLAPTMLLPLIDGLLRNGRSILPVGRTLRIAALRRDAELRIEIVDNAHGLSVDDATVDARDVAHRLRVLYGERGRLAVEPRDAGGIRLLIEIPYVSADSSHR